MTLVWVLLLWLGPAHSVLNMEAEACRAGLMEAEACRAGLLLGIHQGWYEIDIESDSAILIAVLNSSKKDFSEVSRILDDCKNYFNAL
ncbi:hypothetical protein RchiOBHm_Chr5g0004021 [Rosa chinensis]|uniref:RNase H type-1 domain-containing protein n=1 Tax=Rosa chinensis TaxID=74649 RepID=A0A2P6Q2X4_ROSCH|nr:hypothetical protein RchiOBHm_Chr5g0004021 [Rosa chinensis]